MINFLCSRWLLTLSAFVLVPLAVMAPRALAVYLVAFGAITFLIAWMQGSKMPRIVWNSTTVCLTLALLLAVVSCFWSVSPSTTLSKLPGTMVIFVSVVLSVTVVSSLPTDIIKPFLFPLLCGFVVALGFAGFELTTDAFLHRWINGGSLLDPPSLSGNKEGLLSLNKGMASLAVIAWPCLFVAWKYSRTLALSLIAITALMLFLSNSDAPMIAFSFGGVVALCVYWFPKQIYRWIGGLLALLILASPIIVQVLPEPETAAERYHFLTPSAVHRLMIWNTSVDYINEKPLLGFGFQTSRTLTDRSDIEESVLMRNPDGVLFRMTSEPIPLHPHNAMLQWWLELGVLGILLGAVIVGLGVAAFQTLTKPSAAICLGLTFTALFIMANSFGAWQSWWLSAMSISGLLMMGITRPPDRSEPS